MLNETTRLIIEAAQRCKQTSEGQDREFCDFVLKPAPNLFRDAVALKAIELDREIAAIHERLDKMISAMERGH